jgi:hypothetical protein
MRRIWFAIRIFFLAIFNADAARVAEMVVNRASSGSTPTKRPPKAEAKPSPAPPPKPKAAVRSEAITLLAAMQREARFLDFVQEPLGDYSDAQIGAAARDVHRECAKLLDRVFAIRPILSEAEGAEVEVPAPVDAGCYRLTGNVTGQPPLRGRMIHHGWQATVCQLPAWSGSDEAARVLAPVEVEI